MYLSERASPALIGRLPPGERGTRATLELMRRLADAGSRDVRVREQAIGIVRRARVAAHDFDGELKAVFEWVRDRVRYTRDPAGVEALQAPHRTLALLAGDCDDMAMLLVALLRAIGHRAQLAFRAIGTDRRNPRRLSHVYVVARESGREVALDPTVPGTPLGWFYPNATRSLEVPA